MEFQPYALLTFYVKGTFRILSREWSAYPQMVPKYKFDKIS